MQVELLTFQGCPNAGAAEKVLRRALHLENSDAAIDVVNVDSVEAAHRLRFVGSPSVRVNGEDVEMSAQDRTAYGLMCRTYREGTKVAGVPSLDLIRAALRRASLKQ